VNELHKEIRMNWDRDKLLLELSRFSFSEAPPDSPELKKYYAFYGMDFRAAMPSLEQRIGWVRNEDHHIVLQSFRPAAPVGTVFVLHGYFDHAGLYRHLIGHLLERNYAVVMFDLPGHGLSSGSPAVIDSFDKYQSVLRLVLALCQGVMPQPWHAVGQSTGGAILIDYLVHEDAESDEFDKVVLLAPLVRPKGWFRVSLLYRVLKPFRTVVRRSFSPNSEDGQFLEFLKKKDPLQSRWLSVIWVGALKHWISDIEAATPRNRKLLVIQGMADRTVEWRHNVPIIRHLFQNVKTAYIDGGRHHLVNESADKRDRMLRLIDSELRGG
jgi:lysophospholipase